VEVAGLVLLRQRPGTAKGVMFITIEDETGMANLIVWPSVYEKQRRIILSAGMLGGPWPRSARGRDRPYNRPLADGYVRQLGENRRRLNLQSATRFENMRPKAPPSARVADMKPPSFFRSAQ
jgi:DNA polymerase III alpha subunit